MLKNAEQFSEIKTHSQQVIVEGLYFNPTEQY
jgi:hypothetical protein